MKKVALALFLVCGMICLTMPVLAQEIEMPPMPIAGEEEETDIVAGKVATVDVTNNTLTVTDEAGTTYIVTAMEEETSIWKGDDTIDLAEIDIGDSVELEYYKDKEGKLLAIWIDILVREVFPPTEAEPAVVEPSAVPGPEPTPAE